MTNKIVLLFAAISAASTSAFVAPASSSPALAATTPTSALFSAAEAEKDVSDEPEMNPDNPNLPALKGDYDWDARHANDPDWITENIPGKMTLSDLEIAAQVTELTKIEDRFRKIRKGKEYEEARIIGWVPKAETYNGRFAMFFLTVGLLTELWTGTTIPGQIEIMLRVGGFIGPDY